MKINGELLEVPQEQKDWFEKHFRRIRTHAQNTDCPIEEVELNLLGENWRFIDYSNMDKHFLVLMIGYLDCNEDSFMDFMRLLVGFKGLLVKKEYFEMAHNLDLILNETYRYLLKVEEEREDYNEYPL